MSSSLKTPWDPSQMPYPPVRRSDTVETFQSKARGPVQVADPYDWLHHPDSDETKHFVQTQGDFTRKYLDQYRDRTRFADELRKNWDYPRFSCPALKGDGNYYFTFNSGLQPQPSIYRFPKGKETETPELGDVGGELFFDPNLLSTDGSVSRATSAFSDDGKWFAYALSRSGSDWSTIYVRPTSAPHDPKQEVGKDEGRLETDILRFVKFSGIGWTKDSKGFFYQRFPERKGHGADTDDKAGTETDKDVNAALYYHRVGTPQSEDILVYKDEEHPEWMFSGGGTEDGRYVVMTQSRDTARSNLLWIADLEDPANKEIGPNLKWNKVIDTWGELWADVANDGSKFYFYTNANDSPNYKVVTYDLEKPGEGFKDLVPHNPDSPLTSLHIANNDALVLLYSVDVKDELYLHSLATGERIRRLGEGLIGSIDQIAGRREHGEFWFSMTSFTSPGTVYRFDFSDKGAAGEHEGKEAVYREAKVEGIQPSDFVSEQVFYQSKDGTKVPMFITRPKDVEKDGKAPAILYGYGGFSHAMTPFFSPSLMTWIKHYKGILAVANIRGGAEYGETWHLAGTKERKQNCFDDFQHAAKFLIDEKYVGKDKVAISGGSNGGLLVGACVNQAPELFGAAIADVGVLDMLRFDRFTIGKFWQSDYGSSEDPEGFDYLIKYSPLHNVDPSKKPYPPTMLLTADHDDRVVPLHSFKHAAELQYRLPDNPNPLLIRIDTKSGHGAGKSTEKKIEEAVDKYGFVAQSMGLEWHD
ncbi:hypothetical protein Rhopal_002602-T1 [Rhodotorula paludigena]|uniref:Prolyl endopeptidase n=1 Tax=Rhodotorula paludigena TaxID=86838 RepID=A0AAV5GAN5_9BASI|nr:hypothetical protein Rhopal_002602-T1 [Rhodotorula paludigena]